MKFSTRQRSNKWVYSLFSLQPKYTHIKFQPNHTSAVVEGFPRSGNSWLYNFLRLVAPREHLAHHMHSLLPIRWGCEANIPVLIAVREPADACLSLYMLQSSAVDPACVDIRKLKSIFRDYVWFHDSLLDILGSVRDARALIVDTQSFMSGIAGMQDLLSLVSSIGIKRGDDIVPLAHLKGTIEELHLEYNKRELLTPTKATTPTASKEYIKNRILERLMDHSSASSLLAEARSIYELVCSNDKWARSKEMRAE